MANEYYPYFKTIIHHKCSIFTNETYDQIFSPKVFVKIISLIRVFKIEMNIHKIILQFTI